MLQTNLAKFNTKGPWSIFVHGEKFLGYDSTPRVTAANFLC